MAYCSKLSNRLLEKLATPMALVSPSSTVCSKASQVLLMSSGRKSSCRGGNPEPFLNFNGQCMRYKSRYSNCKSLCTHNMLFHQLSLSLSLSLSDRLCLLSALSHWPVNNRVQRWWLIAVVDHPQIQNVEKVFCGKGMRTHKKNQRNCSLSAYLRLFCTVCRTSCGSCAVDGSFDVTNTSSRLTMP